jgi:hypothetical protein
MNKSASHMAFLITLITKSVTPHNNENKGRKEQNEIL